MSMPKISDINPNVTITRYNAVNILIASIAMEELALSHILNAEGEKMQYILGTLDGKDPGEITVCDIMEIGKSSNKVLKSVLKEEMLLLMKLEEAISVAGSTDIAFLTIRGQKMWIDNDNTANTRPDSIILNLYRNETIYRTLNLESPATGINTKSYSFKDLPVSDDQGNSYVYTVDEEIVAGYEKSINGFDITNTLTP